MITAPGIFAHNSNLPTAEATACASSRVCAMWKTLAELLTSKKAIATLVAVLLTATNRIGLQLPEEAVTQIVASIAIYVLGQGFADLGKSRAQLPSVVLMSIACSYAMVA